MKENKFLRFLRSSYTRDVSIILIILLSVIAIIEYWFFAKYAPNYLQRISTYFYSLLPVFGLFFLIYFYSKGKLSDVVSKRRSIRHRLMSAFVVVALLPSTPVFLLSSDTIQRGIQDYLNLNVKSISKVHLNSLRLIYEPRLKLLQSESGLKPCSLISKKWKECFAVNTGAQPRFSSEKAEKYYNYYKSFYHRVENESIEFFIYNSNQGLELNNQEIKKDKKIIAALHSKNRDRVYFHPLNKKEQEIFYAVDSFYQSYLTVSTYRSPIQTSIDIFLALLLIVVLVVTGLMAFFTSKAISEPIVNMANATHLVSSGELAPSRKQIEKLSLENSPGEVQILAKSIYNMIRELEKYKVEQFHKQRSQAWQEVAQRIAHEIKNPLTPMQLSIQRISRQMEKHNEGIPQNFQSVIEQGKKSILSQIETIRRLLDSFSKLARLPAPKKELHYFQNVINEFFEENKPENVEVTVSIRGNSFTYDLDKNQIRQVLLNLLQNSRAAIKEKQGKNKNFKAQIKVVIYFKSIQPKTVIITFRDNGIGIPFENLGKVTDANFSTKKYGEGLGLAIVKKMLSDHGCILSFDSEHDSAKSFTKAKLEFTEENE